MGRGGFGAYLGVERAKNRVWHHLWQSPPQTAKNRQPRDKIGNVSTQGCSEGTGTSGRDGQQVCV